MLFHNVDDGKKLKKKLHFVKWYHSSVKQEQGDNEKNLSV